MAPGHHERGQLLEFPGRLCALAEQRHLLAPRDLLPVSFLVDDERVGRKTEQAHDLGVERRPQQNDRVALFDEAPYLSLLLHHPGARAVDDVQSARPGSSQDLRSNAVGSDDHCRPRRDFVQRVYGLDPLGLKLGDYALVVDDLAERSRPLACGRRFLGFVDRLAHSIAEPCAPRDPNLSNVTHCV